MTPNHTRPRHRSNIRRVRSLCRDALTVIAISATLAVASCTSPKDESPPSRTLGEFCQPLRDFLSEQQVVRDAKVTAFQHQLDKQVAEISDDQMRCDYESTDPDPVDATSILSPLEGEFDFEKTNEFLTSEVRGYVYLDGHSAPVWFRDARQLDQTFQTSSMIDLTTTEGRWHGSITVDGGKLPLPVSDAQISQLADALIAATKRMNETPATS